MDNKKEIQVINKLLKNIDEIRYENFKESFELSQKVYSMSMEINYEAGVAVALLRIGESYVNMGKYEEALPHFFNSLYYSEKENLFDIQTSAYNLLGIIFTDLANYEKSMDFYNRADRIAKKIAKGNKFDKESSYEFYASKISNNIGEIYKLLNSYDDAIFYYNKAISLDEKLNYSGTNGTSLLNLGEMNYLVGKYDEATKLINESIKYLNIYNYKQMESEALRILALINYKKGNYKSAFEYFNSAITIPEEVVLPYYKVGALIDYSTFLIDRKDFNSALKELNKAYEISIKNNIFAKTLEICRKICEVYEDLNIIPQAHKYYKLYFEYEKKLENVRNEERVNSIKIKTALEQLEKEKHVILETSETYRKKSEKLEETIKNISIISELGQKITSTLNLNKIVDMLHNSVQTFMNADSFGIGLYDHKKNVIHYNYFIENNKKVDMPDTSLDNKSSIGAYCLRNKKLVVINDMSSEYSEYLEDINSVNRIGYTFELNSVIYSPLIVNDDLIGVMSIQSLEKNAFSQLHIEMIKALSSYAAIALNNAIKSMNLKLEVQQRKKIQHELEEANNKLLFLSENDSLTGIANRRKFASYLNYEWDKAKKIGTSLALIFFDIDCFKQYNDNYGHIEGDTCIISVANVLASSLEGNYFAARYGGDEFVVILPETKLEAAMNFGDELRKKVEQLNIAHKFSKVKDIVTITLGASSIVPKDNICVDELIREADTALYIAKSRGRNQIAGFDSIKTIVTI